jgi:Tfp pilus assembly protein PilF
MSFFTLRVVAFGLTMLIVGAVCGGLLLRSWTTLDGTACEAAVIEAGQAIDRNDLARAESLSFDAIGLDPESYLPYQELGRIFSMRHETTAAINAYTKAIQKLNSDRGHYRLLQLDASMRRTELLLLRQDIAKLRESSAP